VSGEFERIAEIRRRAVRRSAFVALGLGDDAAVLRPTDGYATCISTDLLVESVHFRLDWTTPELLGHKALAVSLSDMAAMGAIPRAALFSLATPREGSDALARRLYDGIFALADRFQVEVVGGDTSITPGPLVVDSIVVGEVEHGRELRRSGSRDGDDLWVSGVVGSSAHGLALLASGRRYEDAEGSEREAIRAHLAPEPRVSLGRALVERGLATAAIDVSDGLSSDVRHLCDESGVGVVVDATALPSFGTVDEALDGGEQYELAFSARPDASDAIHALARELSIPLTRIGRFEGASDDVLVEFGGTRSPLHPRGWDHFR
jgi:thiamine-monophosphate kinase